MASPAPPDLGRRLRLAVAGAAVATVLTAATAAASPPTPMEGQAPGMSRLSASPSQDPGASTPPSGFLLERGRFKPISFPPGLPDPDPSPFDLNDRGQIVGPYVDLAFQGARGFLLSRGRLVRVDVPGARATQPQGINNRGQIVGKYSNTTGDMTVPGALIRGFLLDRGRYVRLDFPGAVTSQAFDVNDRGQVVGEYKDADGRFHGYVWERGRFRTIDVPGQPGTATATGINNRGQITGQAGPVAARVGFVLDRGRFTTFTVPGAQVTFAFGINDQGQVVGFSAASLTATTASGFLRDARGRFTAINRPGATITAAFDINNRGQIVGVAPIADTPPSPQPTTTPPMARMA
jgi:probable HAF family extracellular repeat protein